MQIGDQVDRLVALGVHTLAGCDEVTLREAASRLGGTGTGTVVVHPSFVPADRLAPLLQREGRPGFVVVDLTDLADFGPVAGVDVPDAPLYVIDGVERGDEYANLSPNEALPAIVDRQRSPLTISEGISWLLQEPHRLEPNRCFMTIGSRKPKARGLDARTPAIWISGGTGRDGKERRGAPKVGWCWAGNRHTWLGFASCSTRRGQDSGPCRTLRSWVLLPS